MTGRAHETYAEAGIPPRLPHQQLVAAQAETLDMPRRRYGPAARLLFATLDAIYGKKRTLSKFKVLELVARVQRPGSAFGEAPPGASRATPSRARRSRQLTRYAA